MQLTGRMFVWREGGLRSIPSTVTEKKKKSL